MCVCATDNLSQGCPLIKKIVRHNTFSWSLLASAPAWVSAHTHTHTHTKGVHSKIFSFMHAAHAPKSGVATYTYRPVYVDVWCKEGETCLTSIIHGPGLSGNGLSHLTEQSAMIYIMFIQSK